MIRAIFLLSLFGAIVPATIFLITVRWLGRLEREPLSVLLLVMTWGAIGGTTGGLIGAAVLENVMAIFNPRLVLETADFALFVPAAEELAKGMVLIALALTPRLSHTTSGLVYGLAVGLGFAITENIVYSIVVFQASGIDSWYANLVVRTLFSSTVHGVCSALFGFCLGWARMRLPGQPRYIFGTIAGFALALTLHGAWNAAMFASAVSGDPLFSLTAFAITPFLVVILLGLTALSLRSEARIITEQLTHESADGLLPPEHIPALASFTARRSHKILPEGPDRSRYIALAGTLALMRYTRSPNRELAPLREEIKALLEKG